MVGFERVMLRGRCSELHPCRCRVRSDGECGSEQGYRDGSLHV